MSKEYPRTDGGTEEPSDDSDPDLSNLDKGARFHEATGGFDEVGKALLILLIIGIGLYIWFIVL